jgi:hypothetical protein
LKSIQQIPALIAIQHLHLLDGNLIEFHKPFAIVYRLMEK